MNKSQLIREALAANPDKTAAEISEVLKSEGLKVSPQYVSTIKSNAKRKAGKKAKRGRPLGSKNVAKRNLVVAQGLRRAVLNTKEGMVFFFGLPASKMNDKALAEKVQQFIKNIG